jgi:hypothetical protein
LINKRERAEFEKLLESALEKRSELLETRMEIERQIAQQGKTVEALSEILDMGVATDLGFKDATTLVIRSAKAALAPTEIRDELRRLGYDIDSYSNPMASLHQVLKRLEAQNEIEEVQSLDSKKRYQAVAGAWQLRARSRPIYDTADTQALRPPRLWIRA